MGRLSAADPRAWQPGMSDIPDVFGRFLSLMMTLLGVCYTRDARDSGCFWLRNRAGVIHVARLIGCRPCMFWRLFKRNRHERVRLSRAGGVRSGCFSAGLSLLAGYGPAAGSELSPPSLWPTCEGRPQETPQKAHFHRTQSPPSPRGIAIWP